MKKDAFDRIAARTPKDSKIFVSKSLDVADRIDAIMKKQGKNQKDLAKLLNKTPSEISKWLSGTHNFTLKSIAKIEAALDSSILEVTKNKQEEKTVRYALTVTIPIPNHSRKQPFKKGRESKVWRAKQATLVHT